MRSRPYPVGAVRVRESSLSGSPGMARYYQSAVRGVNRQLLAVVEKNQSHAAGMAGRWPVNHSPPGTGKLAAA